MKSWILTMLVTLPGVWAGDWKVTFENQCALKGSTVLMKCKYDYPAGNIVTSFSWYKVQNGLTSWKLLLTNTYSTTNNKYTYKGNKWTTCDLEISNVQLADEGEYVFTFETTLSSWRSKRRASLSVRELTAVVKPRTVTEGDRVRLTCESGCPVPVPVVWVRDGWTVSTPVFQAWREAAGKYHCAVHGQETVRSDPVALSVQYAPERVRLSLSPRGNIAQGSAVTLTCSSDASPPVTHSGYRLYKDGQFIAEGFSHTISEVQPSHSGLYRCQAWNNVTSRGSVLFNSTQVRLDVQYRPMNISVSISPAHVGEGSSVNVTCSSAANPAAHSYTWYKRTVSASSGTTVQVGSGPVLSLPSVEGSHAGLYVCQAKNRLGEKNSTEVLLPLVKEQPGSHTLPVLVGVGVSLVVTLLIALTLFWRKRRHLEKKTSSGIQLSERRSCSSSTEDAPVYANVHVPPSAPPLCSALQKDLPPHALMPHGDEVVYSTVTITSPNSSLQHHINNRAPKDSRSATDGNDTAVIYAAVVRSH